MASRVYPYQESQDMIHLASTPLLYSKQTLQINHSTQSSLGTLSLPSGALRCIPWATQGNPGSGSNNEEAGGCPPPKDEEPGD